MYTLALLRLEMKVHGLGHGLELDSDVYIHYSRLDYITMPQELFSSSFAICDNLEL